jgi:hypothetical protein
LAVVFDLRLSTAFDCRWTVPFLRYRSDWLSHSSTLGFNFDQTIVGVLPAADALQTEHQYF